MTVCYEHPSLVVSILHCPSPPWPSGVNAPFRPNLVPCLWSMCQFFQVHRNHSVLTVYHKRHKIHTEAAKLVHKITQLLYTLVHAVNRETWHDTFYVQYYQVLGLKCQHGEALLQLLNKSYRKPTVKEIMYYSCLTWHNRDNFIYILIFGNFQFTYY